MIIAIDGVSGSGKSTLAKRLAVTLDFGFFSAGSFYRAITLEAQRENIGETQDEQLQQMMENIDIKIVYAGDRENRILLFGEDVTEQLHTEEISQNVSKYSQKPFIREKVRGFQRDTKKYNNNIVMEGRDIGSEIFPDADLKIYVTCDVETRAERRCLECRKRGEDVDVDKVKSELVERDYRDIHRKISPLKMCDGALVIDTTQSSVEECLDIIIGRVDEIKNEKRKEVENIITSAIINDREKKASPFQVGDE